MKCKFSVGSSFLPSGRSNDAGIPPMSWDENGELDAKANWPLVHKLWGPHAYVIARRQRAQREKSYCAE
jgi:hypothetical protein